MRRRCAGLFLLFVMGCSAAPPAPSPSQVALLAQLKETQEDWNARRYAAIAKRESEVSCQTSDEVCSHLHLMTGNACFWTFAYPCAADHLEQGLVSSGESFRHLGIDQIQTHLNLLEALRSQQTHETGEASFHTAKRLLGAATAFSVLAPDHSAGPFFLGNAQFLLLRHDIPHTQDKDRLCQELSGLIHTVEEAGPPSTTIRDTTHYRQLLSDMTLAQQALPQCSSN